MSSVSDEKFPTPLANPPTPLTENVKIYPCSWPLNAVVPTLLPLRGPTNDQQSKLKELLVVISGDRRWSACLGFKRCRMKVRRGAVSSLKVVGIVGRLKSVRFSEDQEGFMNLKKASSGPDSSVKAAFRTSSMWCLHAIQRICLQRNSCMIVQQPLWTVDTGGRGCSVEATGDNFLCYLSRNTTDMVQRPKVDT